MTDFDKLGQALVQETSYVASLARSMSLAMEEFYKNLRSVGVSAVTGQGCADFELAVTQAAAEFHSNYVPFLVEQRRDIEEKRQKAIEEQMKSFERGINRAKRGRDSDDLDDLEADVREFSIAE